MTGPALPEAGSAAGRAQALRLGHADQRIPQLIVDLVLGHEAPAWSRLHAPERLELAPGWIVQVEVGRPLLEARAHGQDGDLSEIGVREIAPGAVHVRDGVRRPARRLLGELAVVPAGRWARIKILAVSLRMLIAG